MNFKISFLVYILPFLVIQFSAAQDDPQGMSVMFYNVENLFDVADDPDKRDGEFTPEGGRHWTGWRMREKLLNLSKVILAASGWQAPVIAGMCEVENRKVLEMLINDTPLKNIPYGIIHKESPDARGIDVAMIYNREIFNPLQYACYPLAAGTREILYVQGEIAADTLHFFFNHWPSRYSGLLESRPERIRAAKMLRHLVDSLQQVFHNPRIIIMGDFNDQPNDESINLYLGAKIPEVNTRQTNLYNLSALWQQEGRGTLKYQAQWFIFDQVMVSGSLITSEEGLVARTADIAELPFLLEEDKRYGGMKLNRTWNGFRYNGGFSDHLPILLRLDLKR